MSPGAGMRRRDFIALAGSAVAAFRASPLQAQGAAKVHRLGVLLFGQPQTDPNANSFLQGMRELGYVEGRNIAIDFRYAEGNPERLPGIAADIVQLKPDVLFALGGEVAPFAVKATREIPIVFSVSVDPVSTGLVASLARPGGNATGFTFLLDELASKRLVLLKEAAPSVSNVAFLYNPDHVDNELREARRAASAIGLQLHPIVVRGAGDLGGAFDAALRAGADGLYVVSSRATVTNIARIVDFAAQNRLPMAGGWGAWAQGGALISYGPNVDKVVRQSAGYVDKVFKGARPADLPVQQPAEFELLINLRTAKALQLSIPESFLLQANRIVE